ncbi:hypothetical protein BGHDH14_bgh01930 [Blumeria hordei DH14]|uniref:Uncharacterized protein n=1 Tax=Blumeria graminis f. sp. hordei (strain DH14) TaxID=546991 RepID=N1JHJ3_BLUG1|nr:hypothetical protein BGHDH14_bgh01930 [Blumeria hordei DH14]
MESFSNYSSTPTLDSSTSLRFPAPDADVRVSTWVQSLTTKAMASSDYPAEDGTLGDSSYEFVDTDEESRDDNATESIASTDFGRPDDITSLAGTECSGEDSEEEVSHEENCSILLNKTVDEAFNTPTLGRSSHGVVDKVNRVLPQPIEFDEPLATNPQAVCVKHTVADLNEDQTVAALRGALIENSPKRITVTIRQTMTKRGLSTKVPLRILYIGSHSAMQEIIHKIASSVTAVIDSKARAQNFQSTTSQLYNVVPISAFGSEKTPEIELMHSSGYQIKVENCRLAQSFKHDDSPGKPEDIKLFLDDQFVCQSIQSDDGSFTVHPHWELPHVAIFYCSENESAEKKRTRLIARKFMNRHHIPSIVITHKQIFDRTRCFSLDPHSIHMCLESKDSTKSGSTIHQRLPIDLVSFLNIDARQMNRNLAYITGLYDPLDSSDPTIPSIKSNQDASRENSAFRDDTSILREKIKSDRKNFLSRINAVLIGVFCLSLATVILLIATLNYRNTQFPTISINSRTLSLSSLLRSSNGPNYWTPIASIIPPNPKFKASQNSNIDLEDKSFGSKIQKLIYKRQSSQTKFCLDTSTKSKSSVCTAEVYGDKEILIRIPSQSKRGILNKETISVKITRDGSIVETEQAYSSEEGVVLLLSEKEAFGVIKVIIKTSNRPKVEQSFILDFRSYTQRFGRGFKARLYNFMSGSSWIDRDLFEDFYREIKQILRGTSNKFRCLFRSRNQRNEFSGTESYIKRTFSYFAKKSNSLGKCRKFRLLPRVVRKLLWRIKLFNRRILMAPVLRKPLDSNILSAQVRSKILWLNLQGKSKEASQYRERAASALRYGLAKDH